MCPWLKRRDDLMEPMLSLPLLIMSAWLYLMLHRRVTLPQPLLVGVAIFLGTFILFLFCALWVRSQETDEEERTDELGRS